MVSPIKQHTYIREGSQTVRHSQPVRTRRTIEVNLAVLLQPQLPQPTAQLQRQLLILHKALVGIGAQLKVVPVLINLLLNAIDHLLDLLVLDMGLDQATGTDGFGVSVQARRPPEDVVGRSNIFSGPQDEVFLGVWVSAGNGLARHGFGAGDLDGKWRLLDHAWLDGDVFLGHFL